MTAVDWEAIETQVDANAAWHGTHNGYTNHRCRCDRCKAATRTYVEQREHQLAQVAADVTPNTKATTAQLPPELADRAWLDDALCAQTDPDIFFPEKGGSTRQAKAVCSRCTVRTPCPEEALALEDRYGIRGGLSERERRKLTETRAHQLRVTG